MSAGVLQTDRDPYEVGGDSAGDESLVGELLVSGRCG